MSDYEAVLFIQMYQGEISKIEQDARMVRTTGKGRYVNTTSHGRVYLNDNNVAVLSERTRRGERTGIAVLRRVEEDEATVKRAIAQLFWDFDFTPDYAPYAGGPSAD